MVWPRIACQAKMRRNDSRNHEQESTVNIAILGTGSVGSILGRRWSQAGHAVTFGSRQPEREKVLELLERCAKGTRAVAPREAIADAEAVLLAVPWPAARQSLADVGDFGGRVLMDATNPLTADFSGIELGHTTSAAEQIAAWAPSARVVKAFNTASTKVMTDPTFGEDRAAMFYCGDDAKAKEIVKQLVSDLQFDPVDAGVLASARYLEPLAMLYIHLAFKQGWGSNCAFQILKR
jgi:predicted dinucleotide-binding enzyme